MGAVTKMSVPEGYKKVKAGWIPDDWRYTSIKSFAKVSTGSTPKTDEKENYGGDYLFVSPADLGIKKDIINTRNKLSKIGYSKSRRFPKGSVLFTCIGSTIGKTGIASVDLTSNQQINAILPSNKHDNEYLYYILSHTSPKIKMLAGAQAVPIINKSEFEAQFIPLPPLPEQQKIAKILSTWDKAIEQSQNLIKQLKSRKKGLSDNLLLGKIRVNQKSKSFKKTKLGVEIPTDWDVKTVDSIFQERTEVSKDINQYPLYSLTIEKGLTEKTAQYERSFLLKDKENNKYRLVYNDDILYNPMNLRFGAIAKASITDPVSVSAYYNVIKPIDLDVNTDYFINLFKTHRYMHIYERIAIGSLEEKKRVHLSMFLKLELPFPPFDEQVEITKILTTADNEIKAQEVYLAQLQAQKKGLMQQLLTGQKRVNVNN